MEAIYLGGTVWDSTPTRVHVEAIDGGLEDDGRYQFVCFEATNERGDPVAQIRIRDAGTYAAQKDAARAQFEALGHAVLSVK